MKLWLLFIVLSAPALAAAQSSCSSDGQPRPTALLERFISADCAECWSDSQAPLPRSGQTVLDWIVPGSRGDDAPLSAAALRDALYRLKALGRPAPARNDGVARAAQRGGPALRVAHGLPLNDYIGTSIEIAAPARGNAKSGRWSAWLVLVETIPAGSEGATVERHLVRNTFQTSWDLDKARSQAAQTKHLEYRPMQLPQGVRPERLRVVGWLEDAQGRIHAMAQSDCTPR